MQTRLENQINDGFLSKPFTLLDDKRSKWFLVIFCGIFATVFMLFFNPFNIKQIQYDAAIGRYLPIWTASLIGASVLGITQFGLRPLLGYSRFSRRQFLLWVSFEFICLTGAVFVLFGEYEEPFLVELLLILKYTISLAILPYLIACLLIAVIKLSYQSSVSTSTSLSTGNHLFKDENGKVMLGIPLDRVILLKSENNYTAVHFLQHGSVERKLIRSSLKRMADDIAAERFTRVHRSYLINMDFVDNVKREKGTFSIQLDHLPNIQLKVSDSYKADFESKIRRSANPLS